MATTDPGSGAEVATAGTPLRIALVTPSLEVGGTERVVVRLALGLRRRGHTVVVHCLKPGGVLAGELAAGGVAVTTFPSLRVLVGPRLAWRLAARVVAAAPDVLQTFLYPGNAVGGLAAWLARRRGWRGVLFASARTATHRRAWHPAIERWLTREADRVVCVSDAVRAYTMRALRISPDRVTVIRNGVPLDLIGRSEALPDNAWVSVTRLAADKAVGQLVDAWRLLARGGGAPPLWVVGDGPLRCALEARSRDLPISWRGAVADVGAVLRGARGFVLAARAAEGCPNALLEAMAAGLPIVASRVGGVPEIAADGSEALLVPGGSPPRLAAAVREVDGDEALRLRLGLAARQRAERSHGLARMVERFEALYRGIRLPGQSTDPGVDH